MKTRLALLLLTLQCLVIIFLVLNLNIYNKSNQQVITTLTTPTLDPEHPSRVAYNETNDKHLVNVGRAPFAIAHKRFNCNGFLKSVNNLNFLHVAWLYTTFGNNYTCLRKVMADERLITLQTNLINEPGHRNGRLERQEFLAGIASPSLYNKLLLQKSPWLKAKFVKYVQPLQQLFAANLNPWTECYINPGLESNVSEGAGKVLVQWTRELFPYCKVVWNPLKATTVGKTTADYVEQHGPNPVFKTSSCIANLDGTDIDFKSRKSGESIKHSKNPSLPQNFVEEGNSLYQYMETYGNQCKFVYLWVNEDNCWSYNNPTAGWTPPLARTCNVGQVNTYVAKQIEWANSKGQRQPKEFVYSNQDNQAFKGCSEIKSPNDGDKVGFLLKQSEFSNRGGVIITPKSLNGASSITIYQGKRLIDRYTRSGRFVDRDLWRSTKTPLAYPFKVAIRLQFGKRVVCYKVNNPRVRND